MATSARPVSGTSGDLRTERSAAGGFDLLRWITTVDHKDIGVLYIVASYLFFLLGGLEALLLRIQLAAPTSNFLVGDAYNATFTMHGTTMIFLAFTPMLLGFANYLVPLQIGADDMAFPRLNAFSFWTFLFGGLMLNYSLLAGTPPREGWFAHAPLTEPPWTLTGTIDWWILSLMVTSVGTISTAINLLVTVAKMRAPGMTAFRMPVFTWMSVITSLLIVGAFPSLTAAQIELLFDRQLGTHFFKGGVAGGDPILYQHLFWFFGHPEVYILILPAFGIISEVVPVFSRKPIFGYGFLIASGFFIAFYSFLVWAHHMFTVGLGLLPEGFFGATSLLIAVPTGVKIFSWLATMWGGQLRLTTAMLYAIGMIAMFTIGGITGVHFAMVPLDWQTHDSYYLVAHLHYVLYFGSWFGAQAGIYYWFPKMTGRLLDERLGKWNFWLELLGANLTFFPMHILGLMGMPRRVYSYPEVPAWVSINQVETLGAFIQGVAILIFLYNVWRTLRRGAPAGPNPWDAPTLEWATSSPPPAYNFAAGSLPAIRSNMPLWDLRRAGPSAPSPPPAGPPERPLHLEPPRALTRTGGFLEHLSAPGLATIAFVASDVTLFGALIVSYIDFRTRDQGGPGPGNLSVLGTAVFSLALWASSGTLIIAERFLERRDDRSFARWVLVTLALGAVFLAGQMSEYLRLYSEGVTIGSNMFTSAFYTLTGTHGAHVLVGLLLLSLLAWTAWQRDYRGGTRHVGAVQAISIYWHFVDVVWVVVFAIVYVWSLVGPPG